MSETSETDLISMIREAFLNFPRPVEQITNYIEFFKSILISINDGNIKTFIIPEQISQSITLKTIISKLLEIEDRTEAEDLIVDLDTLKIELLKERAKVLLTQAQIKKKNDKSKLQLVIHELKELVFSPRGKITFEKLDGTQHSLNEKFSIEGIPSEEIPSEEIHSEEIPSEGFSSVNITIKFESDDTIDTIPLKTLLHIIIGDDIIVFVKPTVGGARRKTRKSKFNKKKSKSKRNRKTKNRNRNRKNKNRKYSKKRN